MLQTVHVPDSLSMYSMLLQDDFGLEDLDELDASSICRYAAGTVLFTDVVALPELSPSSSVFLQARMAAVLTRHCCPQVACAVHRCPMDTRHTALNCVHTRGHRPYFGQAQLKMATNLGAPPSSGVIV